MAMSNYLENQLGQHIFSVSSFEKPETIAIALVTDAVEDSDTGSTIPEVSNSNNYARKTVNWGDQWTVSGNQATNTNDIDFNLSSGIWGEITGTAIVDSETYGEGNLLFYGTLENPITISTNNIFRIPAGELVISFN